MDRPTLPETGLTGSAMARYAGITVVVLSVAGLVAGLILVQGLGSYTRASISVSQSALEAISETIEAVDEVALDTSANIAAASRSVDEASTAVDGAISGLDDLATLLDEDIPETIESIQTSMPAAIQAANAVDGTLRALSFFGVDYDPQEPFDESLSRINSALGSLPDEIRAQSESVRELIPAGETLVVEIDQLSAQLDGLGESLGEFTSLAETYESTIVEAENAIELADGSIRWRIWLLRALLILGAIAGIGVGVALLMLGRDVADLHAVMTDSSTDRRHDVEAGASS
jgi:methyl-accepting chemotaxis protein